jgi:hypothetical protein
VDPHFPGTTPQAIEELPQNLWTLVKVAARWWIAQRSSLLSLEGSRESCKIPEGNYDGSARGQVLNPGSCTFQLFGADPSPLDVSSVVARAFGV